MNGYDRFNCVFIGDFSIPHLFYHPIAHKEGSGHIAISQQMPEIFLSDMSNWKDDLRPLPTSRNPNRSFQLDDRLIPAKSFLHKRHNPGCGLP